MKWGKIAVLMGGWSAEREVSLRSGQAVLNALLELGIDAVGVDVQRDQVIEQLQNFDRAFILLHGRGGEDGTIQAVLELLNIPYTGSGVLGSALSMDKLKCKQIWTGMDLPTPDFVVLEKEQDIESVQTIGWPVMIKPAREGSSIGISKVHSEQALLSAWQLATRYDALVLAERWIKGREYTVSLLGNQALPVIQLQTDREFYDYQAKYQSDQTRYLIPSGLDPVQEKAIQSLALQAFRAVGASGWGRVDLLIDERGQAWLIEVNTVPGMTDHSLVPMAAQAAGLDFPSLVLKILEQSFD